MLEAWKITSSPTVRPSQGSAPMAMIKGVRLRGEAIRSCRKNCARAHWNQCRGVTPKAFRIQPSCPGPVVIPSQSSVCFGSAILR